MVTLLDVEKLAFELPEKERATLACRLLESLPPDPISPDEEADIAEALRRDAEMTADPSTIVSFEEFERRMMSRFQ